MSADRETQAPPKDNQELANRLESDALNVERVLSSLRELTPYERVILADMRDAVLALRAPVSAWQPIETAPNGERILLWKANTQEHYVATRVQGGYGLGWLTPDGHEIFKATHWQPLPSPPVSQKEDGR